MGNKADEWIDKIAGAQLPDGYIILLHIRILQKRWSDMSMHEDTMEASPEAAVATMMLLARKTTGFAIRLPIILIRCLSR